MTILKTRKPNVLRYGLLPYNGSLLTTFGRYFLGISGLKRRIYCWIATLHTQNLPLKRDRVRVNAKSFVKRLKARSEELKGGKKKII